MAHLADLPEERKEEEETICLSISPRGRRREKWEENMKEKEEKKMKEMVITGREDSTGKETRWRERFTNLIISFMKVTLSSGLTSHSTLPSKHAFATLYIIFHSFLS
jgi:hypothetical protein